MRSRPKTRSGWLLLLPLGVLLLTPGCFTRLSVDKTAPPLLDLKNYQPVAILPIPDFRGHPGSGFNLQRMIEEGLTQKGFAVVAPERVINALMDLNQSPLSPSPNPNHLPRVGEALGSKILVVGSFLDYRLQKSYILLGHHPSLGWRLYGYQSLPTYHQGICQIRVRLQMIESEKGSTVWTAEGKGKRTQRLRGNHSSPPG